MKLPPNSDPVIAWAKQDCCSVVPVLASYVRKYTMLANPESDWFETNEEDDQDYFPEGWYEIQNYCQEDNDLYYAFFEDEVLCWTKVEFPK